MAKAEEINIGSVGFKRMKGLLGSTLIFLI